MKRPKPIPEQLYVVMNQNSEVFVGLYEGKCQWSSQWHNAKPIPEQGATYIRYSNPKIELIKREEIL